MYFYLIAVDYKTAPLAVRETLYRQRRYIVDFWKSRDAAVLFTCNRIEIYAMAQNKDAALSDLAVFGKEFLGFFGSARLTYGRREVFRHSLRLAAGLESQLQGELQIFQQLVNWRLRDNLPLLLDEFWQEVLSLSRHIRTFSGLDRPEQNIAKAVFCDLDKRVAMDKGKEIVVTGTGKIAELFAVNGDNLAGINFAAHKNFNKAEELAKLAHGKALLLNDLPQALLTADALISATSSPHFLFNKDYFSRIMFRRRKPLYIYDLAVPRDIEPDAAGLEGVILNDLDSLSGVFNEFNSGRIRNITLAGKLVEKTVDELEIADEENPDNRHQAQQFSLTAG